MICNLLQIRYYKDKTMEGNGMTEMSSVHRKAKASQKMYIAHKGKKKKVWGTP
jgi:hypothetical protein